MMSKRDEVIKELKKYYPDVRFKFVMDEDMLTLLYDKRELLEDEEFFNRVCDIAEEILDDKDKEYFSFTYDYLNEINISVDTQLDFNKEVDVIEKKIYTTTPKKSNDEKYVFREEFKGDSTSTLKVEHNGFSLKDVIRYIAELTRISISGYKVEHTEESFRYTGVDI